MGSEQLQKNNTFGATAFTAYGFFWWSLILIWIQPFDSIQSYDNMSMGFYLLFWGIFTLFMFIGTFKHNRASQVVFGTLTALFFLLSIANFTGSSMVHTVAGVVGIICGLSAIYNAMAQIINNEFGKTILPL